MSEIKIQLTEQENQGGVYKSFAHINEYAESKFSVQFFESYSGAKNPEELRKTHEMFLTRDQLSLLADKLQYASR